MKKINKLKLNNVAKQNLEPNEMNKVKGGTDRRCCCACVSFNPGQNTGDIHGANFDGGFEPGYCN